ncbi:averantin oxidoreductase [Pyrenochaeta sp. DS3sAY3a]|nr:averantin oxidoreductase [Pyrenochaeta sp. DS3sAY3a]
MAFLEVASRAAASPVQVLLVSTSAGLFALILYVLAIAVYRIFFHPLSTYPGPKLAATSDLWYVLSHLRGTTPNDILHLHNKYGPIVRIAPDELSYVSPIAWKEIYGHRSGGQPELGKDKKYHAGFGREQSLLNAEREYHGDLRRMLAHGFSDRALRAQEVVIQEYVNLLMKKFDEHGRNGTTPLNMVQWYNFFTFDIIAYLSYGESFNCLSSATMHTWVELFFGVARYHAYYQAMGRLPRSLHGLYKRWYIPKDATATQKLELELSMRLNSSDPDFPDFMFKLIEAHRSGKMSLNQLNTNAKILMAAGSETTATLLSGVTYYLMAYPQTLRKLTNEIRNMFSSASDITMVSVNRCKYLSACLEEALRIYPPSPATHARYVPPGGMTIDGHYVPEDTAVGIAINAICNSPLNFKDPDKFVPERWTGEFKEYEHDRKDAAQVFSMGPRNCIGRNLAYLEMRLVIANLIWHFDLEDVTPGTWRDQKIYMVWDKPPLMVKLKPVREKQA